jgi:hypothetical protein
MRRQTSLACAGLIAGISTQQWPRHRSGDAKYGEPDLGMISVVAKLAVAAARKARPSDIPHHIAQ